MLFANFVFSSDKVIQGLRLSWSRDINIYIRIASIRSKIFLDNNHNIDRIISNSAP